MMCQYHPETVLNYIHWKQVVVILHYIEINYRDSHNST